MYLEKLKYEISEWYFSHFCKGPDSNISVFVGQIVSFMPTYLSAKAAIGNM